MPFVPVKRDWTSKPPIGTSLRADGHWSVLGLQYYVTFDESGPIDSVDKKWGDLQDGATVGFDGEQMLNPTTGTQHAHFTVNPATYPNNTGTIVVRAKPWFTSNGNQINAKFTDNPDGARHTLYTGNATNDTTIHIDGRYAFATESLWRVGDIVTLAAVYDKATDRQDIYSQGKKAATTRTGTWGSNGPPSTVHIGIAATHIQPVNCPVYLYAHYNRMLSGEEIESLTINPWQVYEPETVWQYVAPTLGLGQHAVSPYDGSNYATTSGVTTTSGSCILLFVHWEGTNSIPTITDSNGVSWTQVGTTFQSSTYPSYAAVFKNEGGARSAGHTFTATKANGYPTIWMQEITGNTPYVSGNSTPVALSTSNPTSSGSYSNSVADEIICCFFPTNSGDGTFSFTNSFTSNGDAIASSSYWTGCVATRTVSSLGSYSTDAGLTSPTSWVSGGVILVGVREPSGAATLTQHSFRFFSDDGSESAATAKAAINTNVTLSANDIARLRLLLDATGDPTGKQFQLEYRRKPSGGSFGPWEKV